MRAHYADVPPVSVGSSQSAFPYETHASDRSVVLRHRRWPDWLAKPVSRRSSTWLMPEGRGSLGLVAALATCDTRSHALS